MAETLNWIQPHVSKITGKPVRSNYGNGSYLRRSPSISTVGELKRLLKDVPDDLPFESDVGVAQLVWYNVGFDDEHMEIEEVDDRDDDADADCAGFDDDE